MPIYEYVCEDCKKRYEHLKLSGNGTADCPHCGSRRATLQFSVFAAHSGNGVSSGSETSLPASGCGCTPKTCGCR